MRDITIVQAGDEIKVLDRVSGGLAAAIRQGYEDLRANNPARQPVSVAQHRGGSRHTQ